MTLFEQLLKLNEANEDAIALAKFFTEKLGLDSDSDGPVHFDGKANTLTFTLSSVLGSSEGQQIWGYADVTIKVNFGSFETYAETYNTHGSSYPGHSGGIPEEQGLAIEDFTINAAKANVVFSDFTNANGDGLPPEFGQRNTEIANKYIAKLTQVFSDTATVNALAHTGDTFSEIAHDDNVIRQAEEKSRQDY